MKKFFLAGLLLAALITTPGLRCTGSQNVTAAPVTLNYWRAWDEADDFTDIIKAYQALHPNVTINYRKFRYEEYEQALLEAWAEDRGPDIFSVHNTWLKKYQSKIEPLPKETTTIYTTKTKTWFKTDTTVEKKTTASLTANQIKQQFLPVVYNDVYFDNKIYGLPLSVDTLVLYYNRDLLNAAGIPTPPTTWSEFQQDAAKISKKDKGDNIIVAGAAIGAGQNVARSSDIVSLLMMQNGAQMADSFGNPQFQNLPRELAGRAETPGEGALTFYTDFANPAKEVYSWTLQQNGSLEMFLAGKAGFYFGYAYNLPTIKTQAPNLNFGLTTVPQVDASYPVNFANYWVETVSKKSKNSNWAWDFIQFASKAEQVKSYLDKSEKPTALNSLVNEQKKDEERGVFAEELLTAKSWYRGINPNLAEKYFLEMIDAVVKKQSTTKEAIANGAQKISQTIR